MVNVRPTSKEALSAFAEESTAHMRYLVFAEIAGKERFLNVARLFKAIAYSEQVHARNHFDKLRKYNEDVKITADAPIGHGNTSKNLEPAIRG